MAEDAEGYRRGAETQRGAQGSPHAPAARRPASASPAPDARLGGAYVVSTVVVRGTTCPKKASSSPGANMVPDSFIMMSRISAASRPCR